MQTTKVWRCTKWAICVILITGSSVFSQVSGGKSGGICKKMSINAAQIAKESYGCAKSAYFSDKYSLLCNGTDSAIFFITEVIATIDSCILLAPDSAVTGRKYAEQTKKEAQQTHTLLVASKNREKVKDKQAFLESAVYMAGNVVASAYLTSFYFKDGNLPQPNKLEIKKDTIPKKITKLDIDQALFALLDEELLEKETKNKNEIANLKEKLKEIKDPAKQNKLKAEIKKLEEDEARVEKEERDAKGQLARINKEIEKQPKDAVMSKDQETIFAKSKSRPADEWNSQVLLESEMPMGLVYQVQIGVYKNAVPPETFKGITPVFGKSVIGGITYSTGIFEKAADAKQAKDYVRSLGLHDAFVVPYFDQKKITMAEAAKLEKK